MCGRYSFTLPPEAIRELFRVVTGLNLQPRYNIAPSQDVPVIVRNEGRNDVRSMRWGLYLHGRQIPRWDSA